MVTDQALRSTVYRRLERRNQVVAVLRLAVPLMGVLLLVVLVGQIYLSSVGSRFGIGQISIGRDTITVDAPEYAGLLEDGSAYRVRADAAQAGLDRTDMIELTSATLVVERQDGTVFTVLADEASLDTTHQLVAIEREAEVSQSNGTAGTFIDSVFDWQTQTLTAQGPVALDYADGATVRAEGLVFDAARQLWTFSHATVTLPGTPGAEESRESQ